MRETEKEKNRQSEKDKAREEEKERGGEGDKERDRGRQTYLQTVYIYLQHSRVDRERN